MNNIDIEQFNPTDKSFYSQAQAWYPGLIERGIFHHKEAGDSYSLFRFDDVKSALLDYETFSAKPSPGYEAFMGGVADFVGLMDPPEQKRLRVLMSKALSPTWIESVKQELIQFAGEVVDEALERGEVDFYNDVTKKFVGKVIVGRLHGLPPEEVDYCFDMSERIVGAFGWSSYLSKDDAIVQEKAGVAERGQTEFMAHIGPIVQGRKENPGDDIISRLFSAEANGDRLSDSEVTTMARDLNLGALDTTAASAASFALRLQKSPDQLRLLREKPELIQLATEEGLRLDGAGRQSFRRATADVEINGVVIPAGAEVSLWLAAANVDPSANPDPLRFDIEREKRQTLTFSFGPHMCPGNRLARMEMMVLWSTLLDRTASIEIDESNVEWWASPHVHAPIKVPARFTAK